MDTRASASPPATGGPAAPGAGPRLEIRDLLAAYLETTVTDDTAATLSARLAGARLSAAAARARVRDVLLEHLRES